MTANTTCVAVERATDPLPSKLSETGCVSKQNPREPAPGIVPYDVASPLWSDAASKRRFFALPPGGKITIVATGDRKGDWDFPIGSTLIKSFELEGQMLETRFFVRLKDGSWFGYTYQWAPDGKDATLLGEDSATRDVGDTRWTFPSRVNCVACHTEAAGRSLGLETAQLNSDFVYPGKKVANQLATFEHLSLFSAPIGDPTKLPALPNPLTSSGSKEARARAYLHANCSHCHRPGGIKNGERTVSLDLRYTMPFGETKTCNLAPATNAYSISGAKLIAPGSPDQSIVSFRMKSSISDIRMPVIGTSVVDTEGVALIDAWITDLAACPE